MDKAYCNKCKFLLIITNTTLYTNTEFKCTFYKNQENKDTWFNEIFKYKKKPSEINKNNNCPWFEEIDCEVPEPPTTKDIKESDVKIPNPNIKPTEGSKIQKK